MSEITLIGIDLAKRVFQLQGAHNDGWVAYRKSCNEGFLSRSWSSSPNVQPPCRLARRDMAGVGRNVLNSDRLS